MAYDTEDFEISGQPILQVAGSLDIGREGSWAIEGSRQTNRECGLAFEDPDSAEINRDTAGDDGARSLSSIAHRLGALDR